MLALTRAVKVNMSPCSLCMVGLELHGSKFVLYQTQKSHVHVCLHYTGAYYLVHISVYGLTIVVKFSKSGSQFSVASVKLPNTAHRPNDNNTANTQLPLERKKTGIAHRLSMPFVLVKYNTSCILVNIKVPTVSTGCLLLLGSITYPVHRLEKIRKVLS